MAYCRNCGTKLSEGANFCSNCGNSCNISPNQSSRVIDNKQHKRVHFKTIIGVILAIICVLGGWLTWKGLGDSYSLEGLAEGVLNYDDVGYFSEGLATVKKDGKWGFIDKTGKEVIPCIYEYALVFREGLAEVKKDGKWGFIDKTGKEVVPCIYFSVDNFSEGLAKVAKDEKWGFIDKTGKEVFSLVYDGVSDFSEGLATVKKDGKWGFIDKTGKEVIPCIYEYALVFSEGLAKVKKDGRWGFIDKTGNEVIPCIYEYASHFSEGLACVEKDGKLGFIDKTGNEVFSLEYDGVSDFREGLAFVVKDGKMGFIDKTGKEAVPCIYFSVDFFSEGLAKVAKDEKWGFIDKTGKEVVPLVYDGVSDFSEGLAKVEINGNYGYINYGYIDKKGNSTFDVKNEIVAAKIREKENIIIKNIIKKRVEYIYNQILKFDNFEEQFLSSELNTLLSEEEDLARRCDEYLVDEIIWVGGSDYYRPSIEVVNVEKTADREAIVELMFKRWYNEDSKEKISLYLVNENTEWVIDDIILKHAYQPSLKQYLKELIDYYKKEYAK